MVQRKAKDFHFFQAFSGCDNVSGFRGKGKKSFLQTWNAFPGITETFVKLSRFPVTVEEDDIQKLEEFVILLYDKSSLSSKDIDAARKGFFMHKNIQFDHLPPTKAALKQHIPRAVYLAGIVWGQSLNKDAQLPSPELWAGVKRRTEHGRT